MSAPRDRPGEDCDWLAGKIPVTLVTGFLGSGKTTLISHLLRHPDMDRVAVVINEIGAIGIDNDLVRMSSENVSLLANGCLCCSVRTDLQETLRELFGERRSGAIPDFDRVIVETTGLADPGPVIQTLASDSMLGAHYRLDGVVTLVDAANAIDQLARQPEATQQIALADRVFITKSDLAGAEALRRVRGEITALNPGVDVLLCVNGALHPRDVRGLGLQSNRASRDTLVFLGDHRLQASDGRAGGGYLGERLPGRHHPQVSTLALRFAEPFTWSAFSAAMELLIGLRGQDLLRVKGIANVDEQPVVLQGVGHVFHPPVPLDRWPSEDRQTRLVFITRNIPAEHIRGLFESVGRLGASSPT